MELSEYRQSDLEQQRTGDLMRTVGLLDLRGARALDIGARDGHFSRLLAGHCDEVVALDLEQPRIDHPGVTCVQGDITDLDFEDGYFDLVLCAEVLEHIPPPQLASAASELARVCRGHLLIGVPYKQDTRLGRTTCYSCGGKNPPWAHVNSFDRPKLESLFPGCEVESVSYVGQVAERTNFLSVFLLDLAGNPYGTYVQEEACIHCGEALLAPPERNLAQKVCTRLAFALQRLQQPFIRPHGNWIHMLLRSA
jgi:cyclopropane fatty-acyl-phospholipid synthase-like methyltransferase